jgi:hypothetical protein
MTWRSSELLRWAHRAVKLGTVVLFKAGLIQNGAHGKESTNSTSQWRNASTVSTGEGSTARSDLPPIEKEQAYYATLPVLQQKERVN